MKYAVALHQIRVAGRPAIKPNSGVDSTFKIAELDEFKRLEEANAVRAATSEEIALYQARIKAGEKADVEVEGKAPTPEPTADAVKKTAAGSEKRTTPADPLKPATTAKVAETGDTSKVAASKTSTTSTGVDDI